MKYVFTLLFWTAIPAVIFAQNTEPRKYCGTTQAEKQFMNEHPELVPLIEKEREKLEKFTQDFSKLEKTKLAGQVYIIPVVFHVLHDNGYENISDEQINDAIRILNNDYRKLNDDTSQVITPFKPIIADIEIEFRLAQIDPNGNCTNGIDRIWTNETYRGDSFKSKLNIWPRDKYLNIWTAKFLDNGAAGYSQLPPLSTAQQDGIMVLSDYVGSIGTSATYKSRTLTHEAGHWLNLYHTWGPGNDVGLSSNCSIDDQVGDTPNTIGQYGGCNTAVSSCGANDNVQNYMNYADCSIMFTEGQKTRMRAALNSATAGRNNLWTTTNMVATGVNNSSTLCTADFYTYPTTVCAGEPIQFTDISYNGVRDFHQWDFTGAIPATSNDSNPTVVYSTPGTYPVTLTAGFNGTTYTKTKNSYITVLPAPGKSAPFTESFESTTSVPNSDWSITNVDNTSYKWDLKTGVGYSGTKCLKMNNYGNDTIEHDDLLSSAFDLSNLTAATVKFKVAYCQRSSSTADKLTVYASNNCGQTWAPRFAKSGSTLATTTTQNSVFTPSSINQWMEFSFSLTSTYLVENMRLKFYFEADGGNNLYLDDINITGTYNPVPVLYFPANNSTGVAASPLLNWKSAGNVDSYEYQLDISSSFNSGNLITGTTQFVSLSSDSSDTEFQINNLSLNTKYYWRVRSITAGTPSNWSTVWNFTVGNVGTAINQSSVLSSAFQIFPNPNEGKFELQVTGYGLGDEKTEVKIYNILGELVYNKSLSTSSLSLRRRQGGEAIDFSNQPNGVYFIKLDSGDFSEIKKFVITSK